LRHYHCTHASATGEPNAIIDKHIGNVLQLRNRIGSELVADFDGTGLLCRVNVLFAAPNQGSLDGGEKSNDEKLYYVAPWFQAGAERSNPASRKP